MLWVCCECHLWYALTSSHVMPQHHNRPQPYESNQIKYQCEEDDAKVTMPKKEYCSCCDDYYGRSNCVMLTSTRLRWRRRSLWGRRLGGSPPLFVVFDCLLRIIVLLLWNYGALFAVCDVLVLVNMSRSRYCIMIMNAWWMLFQYYGHVVVPLILDYYCFYSRHIDSGGKWEWLRMMMGVFPRKDEWVVRGGFEGGGRWC